MHPLKLLILTGTLLLASTPGAQALPVEVALSGIVTNAVGATPGGIATGAAFSGVIAFDPVTDLDTSESTMEFSAEDFTLQLEVDGVIFESAPTPGTVRARYGISFIDEDGEAVDADDPGAIPVVYLNAAGSARATATEQELRFALSFSLPLPGEIPSYVVEQLPSTAQELADYFANGQEGVFADVLSLGNASEPPSLNGVRIPPPCGSGADGFCIETLVTHGMPVPEPSTATLLLLGLAAIGTYRRRGR